MVSFLPMLWQAQKNVNTEAKAGIDPDWTETEQQLLAAALPTA